MFIDENDKLRKLVNVNKDAQEFYETAEDQVDRPELRETFQAMKHAHESVVVNLQNYMRRGPEEPEQPQQTVVGGMSKFWAEMMAKISNDVDETFVKHLEEAEDRCLHSIQDAIADDDIRPETRTLLQEEFSTLRQSHDHMKSLKEQMA